MLLKKQHLPLQRCSLLTIRRWILSLLLPALCLLGCQTESGPPGKITLRNDIQDSSFNEVVIDQVATTAGPVSFRIKLKPGEHTVIPHKKVRTLRFTRRYKDFSRVYLVSCPELNTESITLKLIDVHTGRLPGGCGLTKKGVRGASGQLEWEKLD